LQKHQPKIFLQWETPEDFEASKKVAREGGNVARVARKELEARTGKKVVSSLNARTVLQLTENNKEKTKKK